MSKIFVGGLAITVSNEDLGRHFAPFGTVTDVVAMKQRGFGFVEFQEEGAGQAAIDAGPHMLHGKETSVKLAETRETMAEVRGPQDRPGGGPPPSLPNKLFVGGLPRHLDTRLLEEYFSTYGSISDAIVMGDRGFGFVAFHDREAMERALDQDHFFDGQQLSVKLADGQRPTRPSGGGGGGCGGYGGCGGGYGGGYGGDFGGWGKGGGGGCWGGGGIKKVFVGGIPKDMRTPELREFFGWYGPLQDAIAMDGRGFGFVEFVEQASVDNLMRDAGNIVIRGFKCSLRLADGKKSSGPGNGKGGGCGDGGYGGGYGGGGYGGGCGGGCGGGYGGGGYGPSRGSSRKLFIGGLPLEMTDEELRSIFGMFGAITDVKVMTGRGFGFVTFEDQRSVDECLRERHEVQGRNLTVKLADGKGGPGGKGGSPY